MTPISKNNIAAFHALLTKHGLMDEKLSIVKELSNGRASSSKDLYEEEIIPWISAMNAKQPEKTGDPRQKMINKIIAIAREMGVVYREAVVQGNQVKEKSNYSKLNTWMLEKSYLKKPLNDYAYEELTILVSQYNNIYHSWLKMKR